jgi:hypothetical protein
LALGRYSHAWFSNTQFTILIEAPRPTRQILVSFKICEYASDDIPNRIFERSRFRLEYLTDMQGAA